jgi:hypothetical protein
MIAEQKLKPACFELQNKHSVMLHNYVHNSGTFLKQDLDQTGIIPSTFAGSTSENKFCFTINGKKYPMHCHGSQSFLPGPI